MEGFDMFYLHFNELLHTVNRASFNSSEYRKLLKAHTYIIDGAFKIMYETGHKFDRYYQLDKNSPKYER